MIGKTTLQGQFHHYEHSGKLPASHTVMAHNAAFASVKQLDILIYIAIHVIQDQPQSGMRWEQGGPSGVTAVD